VNTISRLKNIHSGSDIYVIASGKSLDFFPISFFENKITVGINQIFKKMPTTYLVYKDPKLLSLAVNTKSRVLVSRHMFGNTNSPLNPIPEKENVFVYEHNRNNPSGKIDYSDIANKLIVSRSTITTGIHAAAYLGAKNIILVAHDCGKINNQMNFNNYQSGLENTPWKDWDQYVAWLNQIEDQTIEVKKELSSFYKCNIVSLNPFINYNLEGNSFSGRNKINSK
jgi:hypothetical protein